MIKEFKEFIARGNVLELAVGLIMATYFGAIIKSFVNDIIMPPVGQMIAGVDFAELKLQIAQLSDELKTLESELKDSGEVEFPGGLRLVERVRKGSIDQKKMEKFGLTVDNFRKPDLTYKTFVEASS